MDDATSPDSGVLDVMQVTAQSGMSTTVCNCCRPWQTFGNTAAAIIACPPAPQAFQSVAAVTKWPPDRVPLSDADVDRIARRLAEILSEAKATP